MLEMEIRRGDIRRWKGDGDKEGDKEGHKDKEGGKMLEMPEMSEIS